MLSDWLDPGFALRWSLAQAEHGDAWRVQLVNPVVLGLCRALAGHDRRGPFGASLFQLLEEQPQALPQLGGVSVIDLGCGDGCLGTQVRAAGAEFVGVERSPPFLERAAEVRGLETCALDLDGPRFDPDRLRDLLRRRCTARTLITCIAVLEELEQPGPLLTTLSDFLSASEWEVPILVVTLDDALFGEVQQGSGADGVVRVPIDSMQPPNLVGVRLRSGLEHERLFRDCGLLVRGREPLPFPATSHGLSDLPTFWAWRLCTRRRRSFTIPPERVDAGLAHLPPELTGRLREIGAQGRMRLYEVPPGQPVLLAHNLGGELGLVLEGSVSVVERRQADPTRVEAAPADGLWGDVTALVRPASRSGQLRLEMPQGSLVGELQAVLRDGVAHFAHEVVAGHRGCLVGMLSANDTRSLLDEGSSIAQLLGTKIGNRVQLLLARQGTTEIGEGWPKDLVDPDHGQVEKEHLSLLRPLYFWRACRALSWAAAIERRSRAKDAPTDVALLDLREASLLIQPDVDEENDSPFKLALRWLHVLRIVDAMPLGVFDKKGRSTRGGESLEELKRAAARSLVLAALRPLREAVEPASRARWSALAEEMADHRGSFTRERWSPTRFFIQAIDELHGLLPPTPEVQDRFRQRTAFLLRLSHIWHDKGGFVFFVIRDVRALRQIALGDQRDLRQALLARARRLIPPQLAFRPEWTDLANASTPDRLAGYLQAATLFFERDLELSRRLLSSGEMASALTSGRYSL